jgi:hypothetical protein
MKEILYIDKSKTKIFFDSMIGGIGWGIGTVIGLATFFAVIGFIATKIQTVPIIGEFVYNVITEVEKLRTR